MLDSFLFFCICVFLQETAHSEARFGILTSNQPANFECQGSRGGRMTCDFHFRAAVGAEFHPRGCQFMKIYPWQFWIKPYLNPSMRPFLESHASPIASAQLC